VSAAFGDAGGDGGRPAPALLLAGVQAPRTHRQLASGDRCGVEGLDCSGGPADLPLASELSRWRT
jgi:hypothetical protein